MATVAQAKRGNSPFLLLSVLFRPSVDWMMPVRVDDCRRVIFPQSTYSNANLLEKHPHRCTQTVRSSSDLGILEPSQVDT